MADLVVTLSGNEAKLQQAMQKIIRQQMELESGFTKVKKKSKEANDEAGNWKASLADVKDGVAGMVTSYAGVSAIISKLNDAMQDHIDLQKKSLEIVTNIGKAQSGASQNMTGMTSDEKRRVFQLTKAIQEETGFSSQEAMVDAFGSAIGVADGENNEEKITKTSQAMTAAARLTVHHPERLANLTRGALAVERITGNRSAQENLAFLQSSADISFVDDNALVAENLAPAIASSMINFKGVDTKQVAAQMSALFAEFTQVIQDKTGEKSSRAAVQFANHLVNVTKDMEGADLLQRLDAVQNSPDLQGQLFDTEWGGEEFKALFEELAKRKNRFATSIAENSKKVVFDSEIYQKQVEEERTLTPELVSSSWKARMSGRSEARVKAENANKQLVREKVASALRANRKGGAVGNVLDSTYESLPYGRVDLASVQGDDIATIEAGIDELQRRQRAIRNTTGSLLFGITSDDQNKINRLQAEVEELRLFARDIKKAREGVNALLPGLQDVTTNLKNGSDEAKKLAKQRGAQAVGRE